MIRLRFAQRLGPAIGPPRTLCEAKRSSGVAQSVVLARAGGRDVAPPARLVALTPGRARSGAFDGATPACPLFRLAGRGKPVGLHLRGQILPVILWIMGLLTIGVGTVSLRATHELRLGRILFDQFQRKAIVQAAVQQAIAVVTQDDPAVDHRQEPWATGRDPHLEPPLFEQVEVGRGSFSVGVTDQSGMLHPGLVDEERKLNLNTASVETLQRLIELVQPEHAALASVNPQAVAQAIGDWRDEAIGTPCQSSPYPCHNAPLASVDELVLVPGMTAALFQVLEPAVTVYGNGLVNVNTADALILNAVGLPGQLIVQARDGNPADATDDHPFSADFTYELSALTGLPEDSPLFAQLTITSSAFEVPARAVLTGDPLAVHLRAVIDRTGKILRWSYLPAA